MRIALLLAYASVPMSFYGQTPQNKMIPSSKNAEYVVTESTLMRKVEFLTDSLCEGRAPGSKGSVEASFWIARSLRMNGLLPIDNSYFQCFTLPKGNAAHNVIGIIPGDPQNDQYIVIGAHYDNLGILNGNLYPGADSNASGVSALISFAEMFHSMRKLGKEYKRSVIFVAFDAKSPSLNGSQRLVDMMSAGLLNDPVTGRAITPDRISLMVNIDQIGCSTSTFKSGRKDYLIMLQGNNSYYGSLLQRCNFKYDVNLEIGFDYYNSEDFTDLFYKRVSDQKAFLGKGIKSVMFTSGITMNTNKTFDTSETLDLTVFKKRVWLIFHWLNKLV